MTSAPTSSQQLAQMFAAIRDGDEPAAGAQDAGKLARARDRGRARGRASSAASDAVEDSRRRTAAPGRHRRCASTPRARVQARPSARRCRALTTVDAELAADPLGQLARPAADLEHASRRHLARRPRTPASARVRPVGVSIRVARAPRALSRSRTPRGRLPGRSRLSRLQDRRARDARDRAPCRRARRSRSRRRPRTRPRGPAPGAFRPAAYASRSACSREWSVDGVVGSQPWSEVMISRSPGRSASRMSSSRRSKSCRQRWKLTGSLRWPQSMSVSTRFDEDEAARRAAAAAPPSC